MVSIYENTIEGKRAFPRIYIPIRARNGRSSSRCCLGGKNAMNYQGNYSFIFSRIESGFTQIGARIIDHKKLMDFIEGFPIERLRPLITEKDRKPETQEGGNQSLLIGFESPCDLIPGPESFVIENLCYCHFGQRFLEFWSGVSKFTEPFCFKHSPRGHRRNGYEYVVFSDNGTVSVHGLRKRKEEKLELIDQYKPD